MCVCVQGYGSGLKEEEETHRHMNVNVTSSGQGTRTVVLQIPRVRFHAIRPVSRDFHGFFPSQQFLSHDFKFFVLIKILV